MIDFWIQGVGIHAPGLVGWAQACPVLAGQQVYQPLEPPRLAPALLPAEVRRRTTDHIRLALEVGGEAVRHAQADAESLWTVFATSESDGSICHNICEEVAKPVPEVSPTRFHNSVTNAPAGYWCMAVQSQAPSTSLCAFDASFAVGLVESAVQLQTEQCSLMLVSHDAPFPEPLHRVRPLQNLFGVALVLAPTPGSNSLARVSVDIAPASHAPSRLSSGDLEGVRTGNPAARSLPLLAALASQARRELFLPYVHSETLRVLVEPVA